MRFILILLAALMIVAATASYAQATDPYQWVGYTTNTFDGSGNGLGFVVMTSACRADFGAGARMCKSSEYMDSDTLNPSGIPVDGAWLRPSWRGFAGATSRLALDETGVEASSRELTCIWWGDNNNSFRGLVLDAGGGFARRSCDVQRPVTCCAPVPVAEPSASLSLPIGTVGLAALAALKGG